MTSDHAEKLLDVNDILNGKYSLFFPRNGGREPIQFYLSAALIKWFGAGLNFTTLKLGMALAFLVGLYFVYKLGKELGNRWTGLLAMLLMGFASWSNIIARVGLRLILCPVFVAPVLYFMLRGFRRSNRNDFILAGIFLGLGLMGYSAFRVMPFVVVLGVLIYVLYQKTGLKRKEGWLALAVMALFAIVVAFPLIHFAIQYPDAIGYRTITRLTSAEVPLAKDIILVFLSNTWNAITMPFWKDGTTWVISVTGRPALDVVTAALYFIGLVVVFVRWLKARRWQDLFLLLSIPVLMLPSILALAFPEENPSLSRAGGAIVPIIIIAAIGLQSILMSLWQKCRASFGKVLVVILALGLVFISANQNYDLVFNQYKNEYANATWESKEIGDVCKDFIDSVGTPDTCYVIGLANWVDTRLVAMVAGYPTMDYALWPKDVQATTADTRAKMFIVKADHADAIALLNQVYPNGFATKHTSSVPGRDFIAYFVPPAGK
jgi:4-amino-4-deoxy-L-arabinose transferase-like glycosyltransferase